MRLRNFAAGAAIAMLVGMVAAHADAVTISATFDSSITTNAEAAQIESAITQVDSFYSAFSNKADVHIYYALGNLGGPGGESLTSLYYASYAGYTGALAADATAHPENAVLNTAVANFQYGNQADHVLFTSADLQALNSNGVDKGALSINGKTYDGEVFLDTGVSAYNFGKGVTPPGQVSGLNVLYHETDEVLGVGGPGSWVGRSSLGPGTWMAAEDLYRYDGGHSPSFTTSTTDNAYFSYNGGVTDVRGFNQTGQGDYADWARTACGPYSVQSWQDCFGDQPTPLTRTSDEVTALQAVGYNLSAAVPEPSTWGLLILGVGMIGFATRRRNAGVALAA